MRVFDVFPFLNEMDLLLTRLVEHAPFVDLFVLVEGDRTFRGSGKASRFDELDPRLAPFRAKIRHTIVPLEATPDGAWTNEIRQRDAGLAAVSGSDGDVIHFSDLDEITSRDHWPTLIDTVGACDIISLRQRFFYYYINLERQERWAKAKIATLRFAQNAGSLNRLRLTDFPATLEPCGWHFSYLGPPGMIADKIRSFSHSEYDQAQFTDQRAISGRIAARKDLFARTTAPMKACAVDATWPREMIENRRWKPFTCSTRPTFEEFARRAKNSVRSFIRPAPIASPNTISTAQQASMLASRRPDDDEGRWRLSIGHVAEALPWLDGWFGIEECCELFRTVVDFCPPGGKVVELGSWKGRSSVVASHAAKLRSSDLFCVDHWAGNLSEGSAHATVTEAASTPVLEEFQRNMCQYAWPNFFVCRGSTQEVAAAWTRGPIDILFIDAGHDFASVSADLASWVPFVRPGGIVCGDDWNHDERPDLGGSVSGAFKAHFHCPPNGGIKGRFWWHRLTNAEETPQARAE